MKFQLTLLIGLLSILFFSCEEPVVKEKKEDPKSLVEVKDGVYTEYYPGRKAVKFKGPQDENKQRDGRWFYFAENGTEQSMTEYSHGKLNGVTFVRYPNGAMRYVGEYMNGEPSGVWKTYKEDGSIESEKDYGIPATATN